MPIVLPRTAHRQFVIDELRRQEIQTTVHYPPVHRLSFYRSLMPALRLPHTEDFARRELTVPLHPQMNAGSVATVVDALAAAAAPHHLM
jgi:dTDP-4-amino-4,6-dideoxygalactose transaminase